MRSPQLAEKTNPMLEGENKQPHADLIKPDSSNLTTGIASPGDNGSIINLEITRRC